MNHSQNKTREFTSNKQVKSYQDGTYRCRDKIRSRDLEMEQSIFIIGQIWHF